MSQHDFNIANQGFPAFRSDMNLAFVAMASTSKGASRPATPFAGQLWIDDSPTPWVWNLFDGADDIKIGEFDIASNEFDLFAAHGLIGLSLPSAPDGTLQVHTASAGAVVASANADDLVVENTQAGITILSADANDSDLLFGAPGNNSGAFLRWNHDANLFRLGTNNASGAITFEVGVASEAVRIDAGGALFIGDTANTNMTVGLTIDQEENDDESIALQSSDVAHGMTSQTETNTYLNAGKRSPTLGGAQIIGFSESTEGLFLLGAYTTDNTTKTTSGSAAVIADARKKSGTSFGAPGADANIFIAAANGAAQFIVDVEGDLFANDDVAGGGSSTMVTLFDGEEDIALCRAFDLLRAEKSGIESQIIRTEWDDWASKYKNRLIELGVRAADGKDGAQGFVNVTQLQRLHNGAICQLHTALIATQKRLAITERKMALLN